MKLLLKTLLFTFLINLTGIVMANDFGLDRTKSAMNQHKMKTNRESGDHKAPKRGKPIRGNGN